MNARERERERALAADLDLARRAARAAGEVHRSLRGGDLRLASKSTAIDLVTRADTESERVVREVVGAERPGDLLLGEEGGEQALGTSQASRGGSPGLPGRRRWIVDPLDGTLNYAHGFPYWAVSVALEVDAQVEVGVVLDSAREEEFFASRGGGAFGAGERLRVSSPRSLQQSLLATGFAYKSEWMAENFPIFERVLPRVRGVRRPGAAALDLAYVAAGRLDGFWELHLAPWDVAAAALIVEEAGGRLSDERGAPYSLGGPFVVASGGVDHAELLAVLAGG
jgi:myo-inositol-1(or 4)-monophosphatase